jgi:hypothetical protein
MLINAALTRLKKFTVAFGPKGQGLYDGPDRNYYLDYHKVAHFYLKYHLKYPKFRMLLFRDEA